MLKKLLGSLAIIACSAGASAQNLCYEDNGQVKSSNNARTPAFYINRDNLRGDFLISNISDVNVTVKLELTDSNGAAYVPHTITYTSNFSGANSPFNAQGATLAPGAMGAIAVKEASNTVSLVNVGKVTWIADGCDLTEALQVAVQSIYNDSGRARATETILNGGNPF